MLPSAPSPSDAGAASAGAGAAASAALDDGVARVLRLSPFAARALAVEADLAGAAPDSAAPRAHARLRELAAAPWTRARQETELDGLLAPAGADVADARVKRLGAALRTLRRRVLLGTMARDVAGLAPLAEVVGAMTDLAQLAVRRGVALLATELAQRHGMPLSAAGVPQDLLVVAMGKGGGAELNVSSDLDLIFVYDEEGETAARAPFAEARAPLSNQEFFERLGRQLIAALSDATGDGFVFRVDMRLRPNGNAGPLVVSATMLEEYLVRQGREWERFAWLKGRVISTPVFADAAQFDVQAAALAAVVRPFVFRKYLDFNAIRSLRDLHALIRAETLKKSARRAAGRDNHDDNVKLGRGGIREIEFIAQTFQIMRGGGDARLRDRATCAALARLGEQALLPPPVSAELTRHYVFLRRVEHALQYVDDAQTHIVPAGDAERARIAALLGLPSAQALTEQLTAAREFVAARFDAIFLAQSAAEADEDGDADLGAEQFAAAGLRDPEEAARRVAQLMASRRVAGSSDATRAAIQRLIARALEALPAQKRVQPDEALARLTRLIETVAGRSTYIALLSQYPAASGRVLRLLGASRWAADYLNQHPILLDELIDDSLSDLSNDSPVDFRAWSADLRTRLDALGDDVEHKMNLMRDAHHAQVFRLLIADLDGRLTVERLADHLSALADAVLEEVLRQVWNALPKRHGPDLRFAVIGYGKYGGKELGYASDLDLVFVSDDAHPDAEAVYITLARRALLWLSTQTSSGSLFDVDLRLRPDGDKGLLVVPFATLARYQRNEDGHGAWLWEHQALTRARFCAGDAELGARFEQLRAEVLARPREPAALAAEVLKMRRRMRDGHPNPSGLFDLKHDESGMVDVEFVTQYLVLAHAHAQPRLIRNLGNIGLLRIAGELGLIDARQAAAAGDAYREYRRLQHALRLNAEPYARVPREDVAPRIEAVRELWRAVFAPSD